MKINWPWAKKAIRPADLALELLEQSASRAGVRITWETALQASTAMACSRVIAEGLAQVPLKLYRALPGGGSEPAREHPLYNLIATAPNGHTTSYEWRETYGLHLALLNRSYAYINRVGVGRAQSIELLPLVPDNVRTELARGGGLRYFVRFKDSDEFAEVDQANILHFKGPSWNALEGLDGVRLAREAIGLALATEEHGARLFKNGAMPGGLLTTDAMLSKEQSDQLKASWQEAQGGLANAYKTAVLWGGIKHQPRAMQNDQAQWVEVRRFQVGEVCRFFRVLPIMVGEADKTATYASSEQMFLAHVVHTMGPWYVRIEQRLDLQLLTEQERRDGYFFRHNLAGLMRGSHEARANYYSKALGAGGSPAWMTQDEVRALDELNPMGGSAAQLPIATNVPAAATPTGA